MTTRFKRYRVATNYHPVNVSYDADAQIVRLFLESSIGAPKAYRLEVVDGELVLIRTA